VFEKVFVPSIACVVVRSTKFCELGPVLPFVIGTMPVMLKAFIFVSAEPSPVKPDALKLPFTSTSEAPVASLRPNNNHVLIEWSLGRKSEGYTD